MVENPQTFLYVVSTWLKWKAHAEFLLTSSGNPAWGLTLLEVPTLQGVFTCTNSVIHMDLDYKTLF